MLCSSPTEATGYPGAAYVSQYSTENYSGCKKWRSDQSVFTKYRINVHETYPAVSCQLQFLPPENETHKVSQSLLACFALYYEIFFILSVQTKVNKNAKHVETGLRKYKNP